MIINYLLYILIFILGACIGSFLNCYIYRLENNKKMSGRSFCPNCKHTLNWQDLFPIFSYLFLGGKCKYCKKKISFQYPLAEIVTGAIFLLIFSAQSGPAVGWNFYNLISLGFWFYIVGALLIIFIYDFKHYLIPDKVLFPAILITVIYDLFLACSGFNISRISNYIFAALIASGFFFAIWVVSKGRWMGFGDVKLAILMGLLLGVQGVLTALFLAFFFGAIIGVMLMILQKKKLKSEIPFGPFLIVGTILSMLWGNQIIQWYLFLFQI